MDSLLIDSVFFGLTVKVSSLMAVAIVFTTVGVTWYLYQILRGQQVVIRSSWMLILSLDAIGLASQFLQGNFDPQLTIFTVAAASVVFLSIWFGQSGWTRTETVCTVAVAVSVVLMFTLPEGGYLVSLAGFTAAAWPLLKGVWSGSHREAIGTWSLLVVGSAMLVIESIVSGETGFIITAIWFGLLQLAIVVPVIYHHGWPRLSWQRSQ